MRAMTALRTADERLLTNGAGGSKHLPRDRLALLRLVAADSHGVGEARVVAIEEGG